MSLANLIALPRPTTDTSGVTITASTGTVTYSIKTPSRYAQFEPIQLQNPILTGLRHGGARTPM